MNTRKIIGGLAFVAASTLIMTGCSGGSAAAPKVDEGEDLVIGGEIIADAKLYESAIEEGNLTFYTGGSEQSEAIATEAFTEATGIKVEIVRLAPNKLTERILAEVGADKLGADVIRISGEDLTQSIANAGAYEAHTLPEDLASSVEKATMEDGLFYNSFDRVYSFAYNTELVAEEDAPKNWADLLDPKWAGQSGIVHVGAGGSTAALTRFQLDVLGEDWVRDYAANGPRIFDSSAGQTDALARGEVSVATIPIATGYGAIQEGAPLVIAVPEEGAAAYPFYVGVSSGASSPNAAQVFVNWLMSKDGQELAASQGDYPVRTDVGDPTIGDITLPPVGSEFAYRATMDESLDNLEADAALWREIFGYTG